MNAIKYAFCSETRGTVAEQQIILMEQGILAQEQGNLLAKTEIHRRMRFSVHTVNHV
jgi:hypothetical protein